MLFVFPPISVTDTKITFCYNFVTPLRYDTFYITLRAVSVLPYIKTKLFSIIIIMTVVTIVIICFAFFPESLVPKVAHQWLSTHNLFFEDNIHYLKH